MIRRCITARLRACNAMPNFAVSGEVSPIQLDEPLISGALPGDYLR